MRGAIQILLIVFVIFLGWEGSKPWQNNYFLNKELEGVAIYATKHSDEEAVQKELKRVLADKGLDTVIQPNQISLERDEDTGTVHLTAEYTANLSILGIDITTIPFKIDIKRAKLESQF